MCPTATRRAILGMVAPLRQAAANLSEGLKDKSREFTDVLKTGRTHLQDAVPITLGQEFGGYAANVEHASADLAASSLQLLELNLGNGTGFEQLF